MCFFLKKRGKLGIVNDWCMETWLMGKLRRTLINVTSVKKDVVGSS